MTAVSDEQNAKEGKYCEHVDEADDNLDKNQTAGGGTGERDYSGAYKKVSEAEKRLVRELDWFIMAILWAMSVLITT